MGPKAVDDTGFIVETYGHASAQHEMDFDTPIATPLTAAQIANGVWTDTTAGDFTVAGSIGKSIVNGVALGTGLTIAAVSGAVGSVTSLSAGAVASIWDADKQGIGKSPYLVEESHSITDMFEHIRQNNGVITLWEIECRRISEDVFDIRPSMLFFCLFNIGSIRINTSDFLRLGSDLRGDKSIATADIEDGRVGADVIEEELRVVHQMVLRVKAIVCFDRQYVDHLSDEGMEREERFYGESESIIHTS
jgi:hypothetical protein